MKKAYVLLLSFTLAFTSMVVAQGNDAFTSPAHDPDILEYASRTKNFDINNLNKKEIDRIKAQMNQSPVYVPSHLTGSKMPLLFEDFQLGMPANWIRIDGDGVAPNALNPFGPAAMGSWGIVSDILGASNDSVAMSTSWLANPVPADDWLITPEIVIGTDISLQWEAVTTDPAFPDGYEVRISTNGGATPADFLANPPLFSIAAENTTWITRNVDLDAAGYSNDTIRIAFRNNSTDQYILLIDDIFIGSFQDTLSPFTLSTPANNARFDITGNFDDTVGFSWNPSASAGGFAIDYIFWIDTVGGNFNPPIDSTFFGGATGFAAPYEDIDQFLAGLGLAVGDSIDLDWTVSAQTVGDTLLATSPHTIRLIRGNVTLNPDNICGATQMFLDTIHVGDNTGATVEPGEPAGTCWIDGPAVENSVWFYFVAPITSNYLTSTDFITPNNDTQLAAYLSSGGCNGALTEIGCNDDISGTNFMSEMFFFANAGDTVWVQVDGYLATSGVFNIQTTEVITYPHDVELDLTTLSLNGPFDYAVIPTPHYPSFTTTATLRNVGTDTVTMATLTNNLNPGALTSNASTPFILPGDSASLTTGPLSLVGGTLYNLDIIASIMESDGDTSNNSISGTATPANSSDSVYARENEITGNGSLGAGAELWMASSFELVVADTLTSITLEFSSVDAARSFELEVRDFSGGVGSNVLWTSAPITNATQDQFYTFMVPGGLVLTPGTYLITVHQTQAVNITLATTDVIFRPGACFFSFDPTVGWTDILAQFTRTYILRANFGNVPAAAISDFNLLSPASGTVLPVEGASTTPVVIDWEDASINTGGSLTYEWLLDNPGGDFSAPLFTSPSDNSGADSELTLDMGIVHNLLTTLGASVGDTVNYIWQARASGSGLDKFAVAEFDITFILGVLGIDKSFYDNTITMFPNPAENRVSIQIENSRVETIEVLNSVGESVIMETWNGETLQSFDLSGLGNGMYIVKFHTKDGAYSQKLMVQ